MPNVPEEKLAALQADPLFTQRFPVHGGAPGWARWCGDGGGW